MLYEQKSIRAAEQKRQLFFQALKYWEHLNGQRERERAFQKEETDEQCGCDALPGL